MPPHAVQSIAMPRVPGRVRREAVGQLAEQVVRGRVVGLAVVAEPAGHRAEGDRRADGQVRGRRHQVEPAVRLHVEDQVELGRLLVGQRPVDEQAARVDEHVDPAVALPHVGDHRRARLGIPQVERCGSAPCRLPPRPLPPRAAPPPPARLPAICLSIAAGVGFSPPLPSPPRSARSSARPGPAGRAHVAIVARGQRRQVEQVEDAPAGGGQVGHDLARDAARRAGHEEHRVGSELQARAAMLRGRAPRSDTLQRSAAVVARPR